MANEIVSWRRVAQEEMPEQEWLEGGVTGRQLLADGPVSKSFGSSARFASVLSIQPKMASGANFASGFVLNDVFGRIASAANFRSRFAVPGGPLARNRYRRCAHSTVETPTGVLLIASGLDPVLRWDGFAAQASPAGVRAPTQAPVLGGSGVGLILGEYFAYVRYIDEDNNPSDLSPISAAYETISSQGDILSVVEFNAASFGAGGSGQGLGANQGSGFNQSPAFTQFLISIVRYPVRITTREPHNLTSGTRISISEVGGAEAVNGDWIVQVIDPVTLALDGVSGIGLHTGGGIYKVGISTFQYSSIPTTDQSRVVRRQILRNTNGQTQTFYVDIDTNDLISTTFSSQRDDEDLATQEAVALLDSDGFILANANSPPPDYKAYLAHHLGRAYLTGEVEYKEGNVRVTFGSASVTGIGTEWGSAVANRFLYVSGATKPHLIASVDVATQTLTLSEVYSGPDAGYADYAIRPPPAERRNVYFSEAGRPESWPPTNAFALQEDGDEITGMFQKDSFLYILERRHVYRFTCQDSPAVDGAVFLAAVRGCVNNRCWVVVEDSAYLLDEQGIHRFGDGREPEQISGPLTPFFDGSSREWRINWSVRCGFHAAHFPQQEAIKWFVALSGCERPRHALCYDYRENRWWIEAYPFGVGASCLGRLGSLPQVYLGAEGRRIFAAESGTLDNADPAAGTVRGTVTSATLLTLTDALAAFSTGLSGTPVAIVAGRGKGQVRLVVSATATTLTVSSPWAELPDATSGYQVGGITWSWRSGWFRYGLSREQNSPRRIELLFRPLDNAATIDMRFRRDRRAAFEAWDQDVTAEDNNGISIARGTTDLVADLTRETGFVQQRFDHHKETYTDGPRFVQWELAGVQGEDAVEIFQLILDGVR